MTKLEPRVAAALLCVFSLSGQSLKVRLPDETAGLD